MSQMEPEIYFATLDDAKREVVRLGQVCASWGEALKEAERERDEQSAYADDWSVKAAMYRDKWEAAEAQITRVREALHEYGGHLSRCNTNMGHEECSCGFAAALAEPAAVEGTPP